LKLANGSTAAFWHGWRPHRMSQLYTVSFENVILMKRGSFQATFLRWERQVCRIFCRLCWL